MLKSDKNFDIFYTKVISYKKLFYQSNKTLSESSDSKMNLNTSFIFQKKSLFFFALNGNLIFSESNSDNNEYNNIIKNIIIKINNIGNVQNSNGRNTITEKMYFNILIINQEKIVIVKIGDINIITLGVFTKETKTSIIKLYLLNNIIMFLNFLDALNNINIDTNNLLQINIYKEFFFSSLDKYYFFITKQLFQRQKYKMKNIFYKNYFLVELNSNKIIFSFESLYNNINNINNNGDKYQLKINNKEHIMNEVLYHCHILKNNYIKNYSLNFNENTYENFFAIFELKSTFPRRTFIIKFLPILNGVCIVHEFVQTKLSSNEGNEMNHYKEYESCYGYFNDIYTLSQKTANSTQSKMALFKNEPNFIKKINFFFVGSLSLINQKKNLFFSGKNNNIFICDDVIKIINNCLINDNISKDNDNNIIMRNIEKKLYDEYLQENKQKDKDNDIDLNIYHNKNIFLFSNDDYLTEENLSQKMDLNITKEYILSILFSKNKLKNTYLTKDKEISLLSKKFLGSKKDCTKLSDILNENISENIGSYYHSTKKLLKENNSFKTSNIFDSTNNNIMNLDNSTNIFNINISIIKNNNKSRIDKINDEENLDSKEEFFEEEKIKNIKCENI